MTSTGTSGFNPLPAVAIGIGQSLVDLVSSNELISATRTAAETWTIVCLLSHALNSYTLNPTAKSPTPYTMKPLNTFAIMSTVGLSYAVATPQIGNLGFNTVPRQWCAGNAPSGASVGPQITSTLSSAKDFLR